LRKINRLESERQTLLNKTDVSIEDIERFWAVKQPADKAQSGGSLLWSQLNALQLERQKIDRLKEEIRRLESNIRGLQQKVDAFGPNEKALRALKRDIDVKSKVYEDLLERFEKSRVTRALGEFEAKDKIKIIDQPFNPIRPLNLPMSVYILLGLVGGLFVGVGFAVFKELLNNRVYDLNTIEQLTGVPVLTRLPRFQHLNTGVS
jgi:outer membrane murein-binding lipoprotein Lpp